jgi:ssDNA-binding Zn-finger/Zn-ribbon topoisomerase 1
MQLIDGKFNENFGGCADYPKIQVTQEMKSNISALPGPCLMDEKNQVS